MSRINQEIKQTYRKAPLEYLDRDRLEFPDENNNKLEHKLGMEQSEEKPSAGMNSIGLNRTRQE
jgi:hypothetical protein